MHSGRIELILGPMFAGKSTELLRRMRRHEHGQKRCLLVKAARDTRYDDACVATHDRQLMRAVSADRLQSESIADLVSKADVIGIDEGQFFPDLVPFAESAANHGKVVIIAALDGDFQRRPFGSVCELVPLCETVEKLSSICMACRRAEAGFTRRICKSTAIELVGGAESYWAVCRGCYHTEAAFEGNIDDRVDHLIADRENL
eukprot:TRINITY_DN2897_c0_g1_i1.p1 TRINITY_DN2897_c0_g1~~TRINITY_DN2897_c0_g1_i1.p1  ORF type:complete len:203 (-),score=37.29 TRINITY_DN2897_c0_g1_i1:356-964(-)